MRLLPPYVRTVAGPTRGDFGFDFSSFGGRRHREDTTQSPWGIRTVASSTDGAIHLDMRCTKPPTRCFCGGTSCKIRTTGRCRNKSLPARAAPNPLTPCHWYSLRGVAGSILGDVGDDGGGEGTHPRQPGLLHVPRGQGREKACLVLARRIKRSQGPQARAQGKRTSRELTHVPTVRCSIPGFLGCSCFLEGGEEVGGGREGSRQQPGCHAATGFVALLVGYSCVATATGAATTATRLPTASAGRGEVVRGAYMHNVQPGTKASSPVEGQAVGRVEVLLFAVDWMWGACVGWYPR